MGVCMRWRRGDGHLDVAWGTMERIQDAMESLGMGFWNEQPYPEWRKGDEFGLTPRELEAAYDAEWKDDYLDSLPADLRERLDQYARAREFTLQWHGSETPGIPLHKFNTNDGWIVTPLECLAAYKIYLKTARVPDNIRHDRWWAWIGFLQGAAGHDGFEVH